MTSTVDRSMRELSSKGDLAIRGALSLLMETRWPHDSEEAAGNLDRSIAYLGDLLAPESPTFMDATVELIHVLEGVHTKVKRASEKYGKQGGFKDMITFPLRRGRCTDILRTCQDDVERALARLVSQKLSYNESQEQLRHLEQFRLLDRLGNGNYGTKGKSIEEIVCLPGTRIEILERIDEWIKDTSSWENRVLWIRGMAGRGKSTIASTVAHHWGSRATCAIFRFHRGQNARDAQFICTLARQLAEGLLPELKNTILECVKENEDVAKESLEGQFKMLIVKSFARLSPMSFPILIIVDGLDECQSIENAVRFVQLIHQYSPSIPINVKFLLTCRPEAQLIVTLESTRWRAEDLDSMSGVSEDIGRFLTATLRGQIRGQYGLPDTWPSAADLWLMTDMSQGLFKWARAAVAYIQNRSPEHRLRELLQHPSKWRGLDELYHDILSSAFKKVDEDPQRKQLLSWVLGTLVVAPLPMTLEAMAFLYADHEIFTGQSNIAQFLRNDILADLSSILHIPNSQSEPVRLMHTSIHDLLATPERCGNQPYYVDPIQTHQRLATISLTIMERGLMQNICNLEGCPKNSEIQDAVASDVAAGLQYCCRSWSIHLTAGAPMLAAASDAASIVIAKFKLFSDQKLLYWLEVMSLIGQMTEAYIIAEQTHHWLLQWPRDISDDSINTLWNDAQRFIAAFFKSISFNALDIYASALPQCPVETELWLKYRGQATASVLVGERERTWPANIWIASADSAVNAVAFSPDGRYLASGLATGVVQLWGRETGALMGDPLTGHSDSITSVVFSPDGEVLASGSHDATVQLWSTWTGAPLREPLTGHNDSITSIVFSLNGRDLASGSHDGTIQVWDPQTGAPLGGPLTGHSGWVTSIAFSPDGKSLASGSWDKTVRLWDVQTGAPLGDPLTGHSDWIQSVVFSPDGEVLASGSQDMTVRLWDARIRAPLGDPLTGHSGSITSVVFSPDGKVLASGSDDQTVRLWDAKTRAPLCDPLTGHSNWIMSVVFSPDGKTLASGSQDKSIRLWDVVRQP